MQVKTTFERLTHRTPPTGRLTVATSTGMAKTPPDQPIQPDDSSSFFTVHNGSGVNPVSTRCQLPRLGALTRRLMYADLARMQDGAARQT